MSAVQAPLSHEIGVRDAAVRAESVCIITEARSFGGVEVHTLGLIQTLIERGYRIDLVVNRYQGYDDIIAKHGWRGKVSVVHTDLDGILYGQASDVDGWERVLRGTQARTLIFPKGNNNFGQIGFLRVCRKKFTRIVFRCKLCRAPSLQAASKG